MKIRTTKKRNDVLFDKWSIVHLFTGIFLGWLINPLVAVIGMVLWEPLEILVLSPLLARVHITFGFETLKNSLSDIVFDIAGVLIGSQLLARILHTPFHWF